MIDAHCHLNSERLARPADRLVADAEAAGVHGIVMAGVDSACWTSQRVLARRFPGRVFPVFGLHPQAVPDLDPASIRAELTSLAELLATDRPVALGETGLDALSPETKSALPVQREVFREQLALARAFDLPVVLHLLRADAEALAVLKADGLPQRGGLVHSFSGAPEFAAALLRLGLHVSFCGTVTLPQSRRLREAARVVPLERLLIETDSPDQTPWAARHAPDGTRLVPMPSNEPAWLPEVAAAVADAREVPVDIIATATSENARRLFDLPAHAAR